MLVLCCLFTFSALVQLVLIHFDYVLSFGALRVFCNRLKITGEDDVAGKELSIALSQLPDPV